MAIDELKYIFSNVNDWLKFAEAKNGALLVGNTAFFVQICDEKMEFLSTFAVVMILLSLIVNLISFLPISLPKCFFIQGKHADPNLLFYGHIANLSEAEFLNKFSNNPTRAFTKLEKQIVHQIVVNASIAQKKYALFFMGSCLTLMGITSFIISILI